MKGEMVEMRVPPISTADAAESTLAGFRSGKAAPYADDTDDREVVIRPRPGWSAIDWKELFVHRELLVFLIWRDISVRYKQTVLGSAWAVLQPLLLMLVFSFFFRRLVGGAALGIDVPYPVFVFAGLIPWTLFSQGYAQAALSLANQQNLLNKVYFPRLFMPVAAASVFLVDLVYSLGIYAALLAYYRVMPSWTVIFLPVLVALTLIATLGLGIVLAALTVFYRDFRHIVPFLTQILMFLTPVIYPVTAVPGKQFHWLLALNPMFGIVGAYRSAILGTGWDWQILGISAGSAIVSFVFAIYFFRRTERLFADFI
jgi:lipopolysaccharide transport system permease protein